MIGLGGFGGVNLGPAGFVQGQDIRRQGGGAAAGKARVKGGGIVAYLADIVHRAAPLDRIRRGYAAKSGSV